MWISRHLEPVLQNRAETRPVVVVTGARQTGKTSLVRRLFPDHTYVSLDLPSEAEQAELDPSGFLRGIRRSRREARSKVFASDQPVAEQGGAALREGG